MKRILSSILDMFVEQIAQETTKKKKKFLVSRRSGRLIA